ncbi:Bromodomain associated domain containing protein [Parasponia andersonii]|uniref:Bromodomain associated domain containing protein n=1 Tax=Parasponia andersonii TaxID=3476 RepID=A0A2P5B9U2_PARAD|nr:Bromodomain associated domain containing protein [Parasponia andersonii]
MKPKPKPKPKSKSIPEPSKGSQATASEPEASPPGFSLAVARIAVAQICASVGFKYTQLSALETLTGVTTKYLETIAKSSASFAAASNRSQTNIFDVTNALHDLRSPHGFSGASNLHRTDYCLLNSSVLAELSDFVDCTVETPFAKPIPQRQVSETDAGKEKKKENENEKKNPIQRAPHIPNWLPELPEMAQCGAALSSCRRRHGEELWENSCCGSEISGALIENGEFVPGAAAAAAAAAKSELGTKRERVRFKIGGRELGVKSGVFKGGKRMVCWDSDSDSDENINCYNKDYNTRVVENEANDHIT